MANPTAGREEPEKVARVLIVDDHPMVRERLTEAIQGELGFAVCGEAEDRWQALEAIKVASPDIVIADLTLKNSNGFDLIKDIRAGWPKIAILVLSMHDESVYAERAIHAGARGYITKQEATKKILLALETVRAGEIYLSEGMAMTIARQAAGHKRARTGLTIDRLSDREFRVFELIGRGHSTREIADQLHLDRRTIETYRARIKEKLNLKDSGELLRTAIHWEQTSRRT